MQPRTTRVQLELAQRSMTRLATLKDKTEAISHAEVVRNALRVYEYLVDKRKAGVKIVTVDENGNTNEIQII